MKINTYSSKEDVALQFAEYLKNKIEEVTIFHIALSGGSTPKVLFDVLVANFKDQINWSKVHLYWGDERCVAPTDEESNYKMTVSHLISKVAIPQENIHRIEGENSPKKEAERYGELLDKVLPKKDGIPCFDLVILGMGDDGHTASIFPHEIDLWHAKNNCVVAIHPESGQNRISLTGGVINNANTVSFLVTGDNKKEKVSEIIGKKGDYTLYPASLVAPKSENLLWFLDQAAAQEMD